jgi:predicted metal-binding transcription factor (methanogenesis marker protein 9)
MDENEMTHAEFMAYLETLAQLIEAKAETKDEAVKIIRDLLEKLK